MMDLGTIQNIRIKPQSNPGEPYARQKTLSSVCNNPAYPPPVCPEACIGVLAPWLSPGAAFSQGAQIMPRFSYTHTGSLGLL